MSNTTIAGLQQILNSLMANSVNTTLAQNCLIELLIKKGLITEEEFKNIVDEKTKLFTEKAQEMQNKPTLIVPGQGV